MEASLCQVKTNNFLLPLYTHKTTLSNIKMKVGSASKVRRLCGKQDSRIELQSEWKDGGRLREKCEEKAMVELLECLEREAIMGEDVGREPLDYDRRAHIFTESARVFRALKEGEAVIGEDEGRELAAYKRRAEIFGESATVFRALKEGSLLCKHDDN